MEKTPIPQNYKNSVDWIIKSYDADDVSFPDGFQKDAIQNAVGARKTNKWENWSCDIAIRNNENGKYLIVEDTGTVGLTGDNFSTDEINKVMSAGKEFPPNQRLARFTSMFNSGGNKTGPGLYGAGKSVYSVASEKYLYYFDSLREDGKYVANVNNVGQVYSKAFEGDEAKDFIYKNTGISPKTTVGTRIIIESPKQELIDSIESKKIVEFIQESWWRIIQRMGKDAHISVNGIPVQMPDDIFNNATHCYELPKAESYAVGYKVKHFGLYVYEDGNNKWSGISYYRKGMKVGSVDIGLKDIPQKIEGKYWGYIEVDEEWENDLAKIEDEVHFGVSKGQKRTTTYQNLKNYTNNKLRECMVNWGYIKDKYNENVKLNNELKEIADELQDLFDNLGFEDLGKGSKKPDFDVRWKDISYPEKNSEQVTAGDKITFTMRIKSSYSSEKRFEYKLFIAEPKTGEIISQITDEKVTIQHNGLFEKHFVFTVNKKSAKQFAENRIILTVKVLGSGKEKRKELIFYFDEDEPDNRRETVNLTLHECKFPREGSRRVNFGESLQDVCYFIENKRNQTLHYKLNVSIHNADDINCPKIVDVSSQEGTIQPFEDCITQPIKDIVFDRKTYEQYLNSGILELRARLIANEDDLQYEKGDRITSYYYKIYLNSDEKNGKKDSFQPECKEYPNDYRRSWYEITGTDRKIIINVSHAAYLNLQDYPDVQKDYMREQMLKQYVLLYLAEGKYDMFNDGERDFLDLEPQDAADQVIQKIESIYFQSLK